jgi:hypothetical protein
MDNINKSFTPVFFFSAVIFLREIKTRYDWRNLSVYSKEMRVSITINREKTGNRIERIPGASVVAHLVFIYVIPKKKKKI